VSRELPSFDLVVATVDRTDELGNLLDSLEAQQYERLRVIVVDQNDDDRVAAFLEGRPFRLERIRAGRGLSHARNAALPLVEADVVAFPDDDCVYPAGTLERVARRFAADPELSGVTGRAEDDGGTSSSSWKPDAAVLTDDNLWNRAISFTIFLRGELVRQVGTFDERLGVGSREPWSSGEEIDYLVRAVRRGARVEYDPTLVIRHAVREDDVHLGARDGASVGYLLRKHAYPARVVARMLVRPFGGFVAACVRLDRGRAQYQLATFRGRVRGYRGTSRAKSSE
jgi:glycosyltransferase involved in cell wall biosynthesis